MTRYVISEGVLLAPLEGSHVLLNRTTGVYHLVNPTGARLLELSRSGLEWELAIDRVAEEMGVERDRVAADAAAFLDAMIARGLLVEQKPE